jgi:hypothetical protein
VGHINCSEYWWAWLGLKECAATDNFIMHGRQKENAWYTVISCETVWFGNVLWTPCRLMHVCGPGSSILPEDTFFLLRLAQNSPNGKEWQENVLRCSALRVMSRAEPSIARFSHLRFQLQVRGPKHQPPGDEALPSFRSWFGAWEEG